MKLTILTITGCLAATMALPVITWADGNSASNESVQTATPATPVLLDLRSVASDASEQAAELVRIQGNQHLEMSAHAEVLDALKSDINKMGAELARLEKVRTSASGVEQKAIDDAAPLLESMARNTQAAIAYLSANENGTWKPAYRTYVNNISIASSRLSNTMGAFVQYSKTLGKEKRLEKTLGLQAGSI